MLVRVAAAAAALVPIHGQPTIAASLPTLVPPCDSALIASYPLLQPSDLHWFELDQPDVVEAKQRLLRQLAAEVPPGTADMADEPLASPGSGLSRHLR